MKLMTPLPRPVRALHVALLIGLGAALVVRAATPPRVVTARAPASAFSAERAMTHVRAIAARPHPSGSPAHDQVRAYLAGELRRLGLDPSIQDATGIGTRYRTAGRVRNIVARIRGSAGTGRAVLLVSHYDTQGAAPGAGDAGSAVAALLETTRALMAGPRPRHDVIVLLTDGEEAGLLGAAAFVREHPWARDVDVVLNFEARGTEGRVFMFETGRGNLDAVRVLRAAGGDVSATSLMVMVYRVLPNDTDLSELMPLARPSMNFAFIDGVERYHTAHDDVAHLDPRSVQHHGEQALGLARAFANGPLPRPDTGDGVFFDVPLAGLVVYPEAWALPAAVLAMALAVLAAVPLRRTAGVRMRGLAATAGFGLVAAVLGVAVAVALGRIITAMHGAAGWHGAPEWRGVYAAAVAAGVIAATAAVWALARRWAAAADAAAGALLLWAGLALAVTVAAPGASYVFVWPVVAVGAALAASQRSGSAVTRSLLLLMATAVVMTMLVPLVYLLGVALGLGAAPAAGALTALATWLVAPHLELLAPARRGTVALLCGGGMLVLLLVGAATVRADARYPVRRNHSHTVLADTLPGDALPLAAIRSDSTDGATRHVVLHIRAPERTLAVSMRTDTRVLGTAIDGRRVDTARYRGHRQAHWEMSYVAPPDSGFTIALSIPAGSPLGLRLGARLSGVPAAVAAAAPRDSARAVASGQGDATFIHRSHRF